MMSFAAASKIKKGLTIASLALVMPLATISTSNAFPAMTNSALSTAAPSLNSDMTKVYWRRGWGYRGGWGWGGVGAGIAAGAIIGGAIAANSYPYGYGYAPGYYAPGYYAPAPAYGYAPAPGGDDVAYCMQRYRSYDPRSGTYLNYDGNRYPCP